MGIFSNFISSLFSNEPTAPEIRRDKVLSSVSDLQIIEDSAMSMVHVINESLEIANKSVIYDTRVSRIQVVKDTLARLKEFSISYPSVSIISIDAVEKSIIDVERETQDMMSYVPNTASESILRHNSRIGEMIADKDSVIKGAVYSATLQLRTPLWILLKDGEKWSGYGTPPEIGEPWHGIWMPELKTWQELGINGMKESVESSCASNIGAVRRSEYFPLLIEIRGIVESDKPMEAKIKLLQSVMGKKKYSNILNQNDNYNSFSM